MSSDKIKEKREERSQGEDEFSEALLKQIGQRDEHSDEEPWDDGSHGINPESTEWDTMGTPKDFILNGDGTIILADDLKDFILNDDGIYVYAAVKLAEDGERVSRTRRSNFEVGFSDKEIDWSERYFIGRDEEVYYITMKDDKCDTAECIDILKEIGCDESNFLYRSPNIPGRFYARLKKQEAEKLQGVSRLHTFYPATEHLVNPCL